MLRPPVCARVEEPDEFACPPQDRPNVAPLLAVAKGARIRQVVWLCRTAVLHADDVINLTAEEGIVLVNQAILAQRLSASDDEVSQVFADVSTHD
jgi:hypothetical protein